MKKLKVIYLRKAQEDIGDITYYIAQDNLEKAVAFASYHNREWASKMNQSAHQCIKMNHVN
jgi:plasmid stabilization system protein ParE